MPPVITPSSRSNCLVLYRIVAASARGLHNRNSCETVHGINHEKESIPHDSTSQELSYSSQGRLATHKVRRLRVCLQVSFRDAFLLRTEDLGDVAEDVGLGNTL